MEDNISLNMGLLAQIEKISSQVKIMSIKDFEKWLTAPPTKEELEAKRRNKQAIRRNVYFFSHLPLKDVLTHFSKEEQRILIWFVRLSNTGVILTGSKGVSVLDKAKQYIEEKLPIEDSLYHAVREELFEGLM